MSSEATKSAVLAKCEEVAPEVGKTYEMSKGTILKTNDRQVGDRFTEYRVDEYRDGSWVGLAFCDETPADSYVWALAADILKITPSIDEFEDDLSRRQYHHDLEVARMEGYEQGSKVAIGIANITTDALGLPRVFVDGEAVEVVKAPSPSDALLWECWKMGVESVSPMAQIVEKTPFRRWLATIPPDTLKADRELAQEFLSSFDEYNSLFLDRDSKYVPPLKRLAGMEAPNE